MASTPKSRPSFSVSGRWRIAFDVILRTVLMLAVVVMVNDLGLKFFHRYYLSALTRLELSPRTLNVLHTLTNHVSVTLYYDRSDEFLPDITALLKEYSAENPKISMRTVDYINDPGAAEKIKAQYRQFFTSTTDKNLVIFDCGGRVKIVPGAALQTYQPKFKGMTTNPDNPQKQEMEFERRPVSFNAEQAFTGMLLALSSPQPQKAYFLQHHGEPALADSSNTGYQKFLSALQENYVLVTNLDFMGNTGVPMDCNLLIIAGPTEPLQPTELDQVDRYLREGGRMLIMFNAASQGHPTGLENILQKWGVGVADDIAQDPDHTISQRDVVVDQFRQHPVVAALSQVQLQLYLPRPIIKLTPANPSANAPQVDELFGTSPNATLLGNPSEPPHQYPLAVAVEQKPVAGAPTPRGNTRIIVIGDSVFFGNYYIEGGTAGANRDFLDACINWLCDRPTLVEGIGPRPVKEFRLEITRHQQQQLSWLLLGALPGGALFIGWLVWLVRRK